jgi:ribosome-associated translation inhibitor RaiA
MSTKIIITGLDPGLRESTCADLDAMAEKLFRHHAQVIHLQFEVSVKTLPSGTRAYNVAGLARLQKPHVIAALETGDDLCKSIETVVDKMERMLNESMLSKHRQAIEDKRRPAHGVVLPAYAMTNKHPG